MRFRLSPQHIPILATAVVWLVLFVSASLRYDYFFSWKPADLVTWENYAVLINLLRDNAFLGLAAIGMTFVILSGGIDLSVGAMIGFTSILIATLMTNHAWPAHAAIPLALAAGTALGGLMGGIIAFLGLPPFLVTLGGMFLIRGLAFVTSMESLTIANAFYDAIDELGYEYFPVTAIVFLAALAIAMFVARRTRFGRNVYAIGGSEQSALLMGLPVPSTKVRIYALSGLCSAMAGVLYTFYTYSGNANAGMGLELDAIAAVVIGGTPLAGGIGYVAGTLLGVMILGTIQTIITFDGRLNTWWTRIVIGVLLLIFILLQKVVQAQALRRKSDAGGGGGAGMAPGTVPAGAAT